MTAAVAVVLSLASGLEADELQVLAAKSLCEASAALPSPWDDGKILVADNELEDQLFVFSIEDDRLAPKLTMALPDGTTPHDVESLARVGDDLLVVGSFSRNSDCQEKTNRQRLRLLERRSDGSLKEKRLIDGEEAWAEARKGESECLKTLFSSRPPSLAAEACRALLEAEKAAAEGDGCPVLNIEGAVNTDDKRVWLGLRAPLADGQAMLLRLTSKLDRFRFDKVAFLDLERRGVRELAFADETVYGIGGPVEDATDPFALFSVAADEVNAGGRLKPKILRRDLETSSEGMAVVDGRAWITVDGDEGEPECTVPSRQYFVDLPE